MSNFRKGFVEQITHRMKLGVPFDLFIYLIFSLVSVRYKIYFFYNRQKNVTFMHRYQVAKYVIFDSEKIFVKKFPWMLK
jgi:hypothetical protein